MKKHLFVLAAAIAFASMANAQFYGNVATGRGGQMSIYGGIASITAKPQFKFNTLTTGRWSYTYYVMEKVKADKLSASMGPSFLITFSSLNDYSEQFKIGAMLGVGYAKSEWQADFSAATLGALNDFSLWAKSNLIDIQLGIEGSYRVAEPVSIDFAVGPSILFSTGNQARTERYAGGVLIPDADANEWHEATKSDDFGAPSIDIGAFGRVGGCYHFSEKMWAGLAFQYILPFFNFSTVLQDDYSNDGYRIADNNFIFSDIKHSGWSLMLTFGVNFE